MLYGKFLCVHTHRSEWLNFNENEITVFVYMYISITSTVYIRYNKDISRFLVIKLAPGWKLSMPRKDCVDVQ